MTDEVTKEVFARLRAMETQTKEIHTAVVGNRDLGHEGLVETVRQHNARLSSLEQWRWWVIGGSASILAGLEIYRTFH